MRMFLIVMTDVFLILYLTAAANLAPQAILTVEDFFTLKSMHESLKEDKQKAEEALVNVEKDNENLNAKLNEEQERLEDLEQTLELSDAQLQRINEDLQAKENMLKEREQLLANLNKKIETKEETWQEMQKNLTKELESKKETVEANQELVEKLKTEALNAQQLANQMKEEVTQAYKTAEVAQEVQIKAVTLKEQALKEKEEAERRAKEALAARNKAEAEKEVAEQKAFTLSKTIKDIKQDGQEAYTNNIQPFMQTLNISYKREIGSTTATYRRELFLLPIKIDGAAYLVFPSKQIGFSTRSDRAPDELVIEFAGQRIRNGRINKENDLIAISLKEFKGTSAIPFKPEMKIEDLMPALLALRNNGNKSLSDKIRGLSDQYFIVKRDYIKPSTDSILEYDVKGFRGTGTHAEQIVRGDQLVDLNGRLIGIANEANQVIRINTLNTWSETVF